MLGLRYVFLQEPARGWLADGTLDWLWAAAERAVRACGLPSTTWADGAATLL